MYDGDPLKYRTLPSVYRVRWGSFAERSPQKQVLMGYPFLLSTGRGLVVRCYGEWLVFSAP